MRRLVLAAPLLIVATAAHAEPRTAAPADAGLDRMAQTLADPVRQQALAKTLGAMTDVLLDVPLAPILGPLAEAAGEDPRRIDRDATLRKMSPGAGDVSRQVERTLPQAMRAMAGMSGAMATMLPQLRAVAEKLRDTLPAVMDAARPAEMPPATD